MACNTYPFKKYLNRVRYIIQIKELPAEAAMKLYNKLFKLMGNELLPFIYNEWTVLDVINLMSKDNFKDLIKEIKSVALTAIINKKPLDEKRFESFGGEGLQLVFDIFSLVLSVNFKEFLESRKRNDRMQFAGGGQDIRLGQAQEVEKVDLSKDFPDLSHFIHRPLIEGADLCSLIELQDGTYSLTDIALFHDILDYRLRLKEEQGGEE